ncbi:hypothetical protein Atai01_82570 [Amycolatopsis taiwanensis]|uniref:Uncharacterized protein n=1 Tax=Amycolatopsis taiwanensis TaxID=342230 RepID=A0A9W6R9W7_9PSEU|nr:hypothetical protein Atai01_82570 [Amycolatopsis taiwanensis]
MSRTDAGPRHGVQSKSPGWLPLDFPSLRRHEFGMFAAAHSRTFTAVDAVLLEPIVQARLTNPNSRAA